MTKTFKEVVEEGKEEFVEEGADIEHDRWSKWQAYLHSKCVEHENGKGEWVCFPSERFRHWERQIKTPYSELSEKEKESDRAEVRSYLVLLDTFAAKIRQATLAEAREKIERQANFRPISPHEDEQATEDALTALEDKEESV